MCEQSWEEEKCVRKVLQGILWQNGMSSVHCLVHSSLKNLTPLHNFNKIPNVLPKILKRLRNKNNLKWTIMNRVQFTFFSKWYWDMYHFHLQISGKWLDFKELLIKIDYPFQWVHQPFNSHRRLTCNFSL